ncbi:MAG: hypothetical protein QOK02_2119 [Mycobacterium sp.]|jgi:hypothetical protein|nr:hypothetical protein [Mycobacterium sp.]
MDVRFKSRIVVAVLVIYGVYSTVGGLVMLFAPDFMFDTVGGFGVRNYHYIFDLAGFELPLGLMYFAAIRWPAWRVPTLAFATAHYLLHAISHLVDIDTATPRWVGVFDFGTLAVGLVVHAIAVWFSVGAAPAIRR